MNQRRTYRFKATETFWRNFYGLSSEQKSSCRDKWKIFKEDPFHPSLGAHKIHALSGRAGKTVYSAEIEGDLRVVFWIDDDIVLSLDIGTHAVYQ